jgi:putative nucleotidyltransferase with HDIG domain
MPLPGDRFGVRPAADLLAEARDREQAGCIPEAIAGYEAAIAEAERASERAVLAQALRRLAVQRRHHDQSDEARALCRRSYEVAKQEGHHLLAAEALNTLGGLDLTTGKLEDARKNFLAALEIAGEDRALKARVEQNLGILANIQGELDEALSRYRHSLEAYDAVRDLNGCAIAYHNLGMVSADKGQLDKAQKYFSEARAIAERVGDVHLQALSLVNEAEVDVARQRFENARQSAEASLTLIEQLGGHGAKADAYRVIGMVYRETGRPVLAESRLKTAIELAQAADSVLYEAEASRELAILFQGMGRNHEALVLLGRAHGLFQKLDARADLVQVGGKAAELQGTYLAVVRGWGQSIESRDSYTFGHCERVAQFAVAMARVLGLDEQQETTLMLGAYLHDLGLVRVPHEILTKPTPLTSDERAVVQQHPLWGLELLADVEFPWDIKPIIRWHHERYDGTGYPDGLSRDEIPLLAQIVGIVEYFDALTSPRSGPPQLSVDRAVASVIERGWWPARVVAAFVKAVSETSRTL